MKLSKYKRPEGTKQKRWSFPSTKRALVALIATPTLLALVGVSIGLAFGMDARHLLGIVLWCFAIFAIPAAPIVLVMAFSSDAIDEGKEHIANRRIIRAREKMPIAGAMSIAADGGDLSDAEESRSGAVAEVDG